MIHNREEQLVAPLIKLKTIDCEGVDLLLTRDLKLVKIKRE